MASQTVLLIAMTAFVYLFTVSALPASRNFTVIKLFPPSPQQNTSGESPVPQGTDKGVMADQRSAFLGKSADAFRFHRPGFEHVPGSVSLESATHPGLYLRYKNYKFHLEKTKPSGVFEKDATFIERKTQTKGASAYELFNHPGWFMCHDTKSSFGLVAKKLEIGSNDFLVGCLYMSVAVPRTPTKKPTEEQPASTRGDIQNITDIISNDVSAENLAKGNKLMNGSQRTAVKDQQSLSTINTTDSKPAQQLTVLSNSTSHKTSDNDMPSDIKVEIETKPMASTKQSADEKIVNDVHTANDTQNTLKPNTDLLNKTSILASHKGNKFSQKNNKIVEDLASAKAPNTTSKGNEESLAKQKSPDSGSADDGSATLHILNALQGAFKVAKQKGEVGIHTGKSLTTENGIRVTAGETNLTQKGKSVVLQQGQTGLHSPITPNKVTNENAPKQFNLHFEFPNGPNQGHNYRQSVNGLPGPANFPLSGQLAQTAAKVLGFVQNAFKGQPKQPVYQQVGLQYTKGAGLPFMKQQQQQPQHHQQQQFHRPVDYYKQPMHPQANFRPPIFRTAPAHALLGRPLTNPFVIKGQHSQSAFKQAPFVNNGYSYPYPFKNWRGVASVGKQSLVGNSASYPNVSPTKPFHEKTSARLDDDMSTRTPTKYDKCISLKFINKIRKPIKLVSSMKLGGYLISAETFKLKTIFKHPRKHHHVIFYARDADDIDNEVLLNNNNAIAVTPGGCDLPFRSVLLSHHGQISNDEIEHLREEDEYAASMEAAKKGIPGKGEENFTQWTAFGPCAATCGRSTQTRTRFCKPGKMCKGQIVESRTCIQTPCPASTCVKTYSGKCCALPFVFHGVAVSRCLTDPKSNRPWCATTPNFDKEKRWGYCQPSGPHTEKIAPVIRSFLPGSSRRTQPFLGQCVETCKQICMSWCPQRCCLTAKH